jgi:hypothetical protein
MEAAQEFLAAFWAASPASATGKGLVFSGTRAGGLAIFFFPSAFLLLAFPLCVLVVCPVIGDDTIRQDVSITATIKLLINQLLFSALP